MMPRPELKPAVPPPLGAIEAAAVAARMRALGTPSPSPAALHRASDERERAARAWALGDAVAAAMR